MHHPDPAMNAAVAAAAAAAGKRAHSSLVASTPTSSASKKPKILPHGGLEQFNAALAKQQQESSNVDYNRKKKSLGVLAENFMERYQDSPPGSVIVLDEAANEFEVERRRIYDVVNILESICILVKKAKNTYTWLGKSNLDQIFGQLQAEAIAEFPHEAQRFGLQCAPGTTAAGTTNEALAEVSRRPKARENRSLARLSQEFLQLYLIGHTNLSLPEASDIIQGQSSMEELVAKGQGMYQQYPHDPLENVNDPKTVAKRGLKTKIRRLYDIANVFKSVGLLNKIEVENPGRDRRPRFSWAYPLNNKEIQSIYHNHLLSQHTSTLTPTAAYTHATTHPRIQAFHPGMAKVTVEPTSSSEENNSSRSSSATTTTASSIPPLAPAAAAPTPPGASGV